MSSVITLYLDALRQTHAAWLEAAAVLRDGRGNGMSSIIDEEEKRAAWDEMFTAEIRNALLATAATLEKVGAWVSQQQTFNYAKANGSRFQEGRQCAKAEVMAILDGLPVQAQIDISGIHDRATVARIRGLFDAKREGRCDPDVDADDWLALIEEVVGR